MGRNYRAWLILAALLVPAASPWAQASPAPQFAAMTEAPVPAAIPVVLLVDLSTGQELFAREASRRFVPASVTKVMTAYTAFRLTDEGRLPLDRTYQYSAALEEAWYGEGSSMFLRAGERPSVGQLLLGVTTVSGNDASEALAIAATGSLDAWLARMNADAAQLRMADTHFGSPNGFPDGGSTYTTARDLAKLGRALTQDYPGLYRRFFGHRQLTWRNITQPNHDPVTGQVEGGDGIKTGFTAEAGFTVMGSAERGGRRLLVVLAAAPSAAMRDKAARDLLEWGFARFTPVPLLGAGAMIGSARVQDGAASAVPLRLAADLALALPAGRNEGIAAQVIYHGPVAAPVAQGQVIARLRLEIPGAPPVEVPLEAAASVARANGWQRIGNALARWLA